MHKQLHWINSAAVEESGSDISYEINVQNIGKITAAHIHMGRSGKKNGPIVASLFEPQTPTGITSRKLASGC